ncbi:hypothetical protein JOC37_000864 [Desulfohalotomaculum tongense]|nr:hypothetical protein [Desulforadius tongensis]
MGFLVAMLAPRLANVATGASDTICDTNQQRLRQVLGAYTENYGQLPNKLTNLVINTGADPYTAADYADTDAAGYIDDNKKDYKEVLSRDMDAMVHLKRHVLNAAEAQELIDLGISQVYNLNPSSTVDEKYSSTYPQAAHPYMELVDVKEGLSVLMVGAGCPDAATDNFSDITDSTDPDWGNPDLIYRIILGVGPDSDLVTEGQIQDAALCPNGMRRGDHFIYNNYNVIVPRLQATVDRIATGDAEKVDVEYPSGEVKTFDLTEAQEVWQFTTFCPEGCQLMGVGEPELKITVTTKS